LAWPVGAVADPATGVELAASEVADGTARTGGDAEGGTLGGGTGFTGAGEGPNRAFTRNGASAMSAAPTPSALHKLGFRAGAGVPVGGVFAAEATWPEGTTSAKRGLA
jgi:hypothetical protein